LLLSPRAGLLRQIRKCMTIIARDEVQSVLLRFPGFLYERRQRGFDRGLHRDPRRGLKYSFIALSAILEIEYVPLTLGNLLWLIAANTSCWRSLLNAVIARLALRIQFHLGRRIWIRILPLAGPR